MSTGPSMAPSSAKISPPSEQTPIQVRQALLKEVGAKWNKFSESELSALKSNDDLVTHVVGKYSLEKAKAQTEVDTLMKGRHI